MELNDLGLLPTLRVANWEKPPTRVNRPTLQSPSQTPGHLWKEKKKKIATQLLSDAEN